MTEQQWLDRVLSPTERCNPHAKRQQRAVYEGWIKPCGNSQPSTPATSSPVSALSAEAGRSSPTR